MSKLFTTSLLLSLMIVMQGCNLDDLKESFESDDEEVDVIELEEMYMAPAIPVGLDSKYLPPVMSINR